MRERSNAIGDGIPGWPLLWFVLGCDFVSMVLQWAIERALHLGNSGTLKPEFSAMVHIHQWTDSWLPMMKSLDYFQANPTLPIYAAKLYDTLIYPLASLLPLVFLRKLGIADARMLSILAIASWLAVIGIIPILFVMAKRLLGQRGVPLTWPAAAAIAVGCITCYPLLKGFALGNAQTFLSFGFAVLMLLWVSRRERAGGVVAAMLAFVKPQYVLLLIWMAVRKKWGAAAAFLIAAAVLLLGSIAVFGWHNNFDYIAVLASLSHKAQSNFANQSMFGTLNRMIFNGENLTYTPHLYTPYVPWIYRVTVATSIVLTGTMLLFPWGKLRGSAGDLGAMGLASVAASPMAWEHHYGIVLGIICWAWFAYGWREQRKPWMLALSYFLCTNFLSFTTLLASHRGWNILQSYMYFGVLLLLGCLMAMARRITRRAEPASSLHAMKTAPASATQLA